MKVHTPKRNRSERDKRGPWLADLHAAHGIEAAGVPGVVVPIRVWGAVSRDSARWGAGDPARYEHGRGRWLRCPTLDQQEGNAGEGFGDGDST